MYDVLLFTAERERERERENERERELFWLYVVCCECLR